MVKSKSSPPAQRRVLADTCVRLNIKEVLGAPSRNMEAQLDMRLCRGLGSPKGQLYVPEGVGGCGLPARALQAPSFSQRQYHSQRIPNSRTGVREQHDADDFLLPRCRNMESPPSWNSSDPIVRRPPHNCCGVGGVLYSFTQDYVVSHLEQSFLLLSSLSREPKGQRNKHCCATNSGDCSAEYTG